MSALDLRGLDRESRDRARRGFAVDTLGPGQGIAVPGSAATDPGTLVYCCGRPMLYDGRRHVCQECRATDPPVKLRAATGPRQPYYPGSYR